MEKKEFPVDRILRVSQAIDLVDNNSAIDSTISWRLGRIGDSCASVKRRFEKAQNKLINEFNSKRMQLVGKTPEKDLPQEVRDEITDLSNSLNNNIDDLRDKNDEMSISNFSLKDFTAKEDMKVNQEIKNPDGSTKFEVINYKKDQLVVTIKFLKLMGDLISE